MSRRWIGLPEWSLACGLLAQWLPGWPMHTAVLGMASWPHTNSVLQPVARVGTRISLGELWYS